MGATERRGPLSLKLENVKIIYYWKLVNSHNSCYLFSKVVGMPWNLQIGSMLSSINCPDHSLLWSSIRLRIYINHPGPMRGDGKGFLQGPDFKWHTVLSEGHFVGYVLWKSRRGNTLVGPQLKVKSFFGYLFHKSQISPPDPNSSLRPWNHPINIPNKPVFKSITLFYMMTNPVRLIKNCHSFYLPISISNGIV